MQLYADAEPDAYSTTDGYSNANTEPNSDSYTNCDTDAYPNSDSNSHANTNSYTNPNACADTGHDLGQRLTERSRDSNRRGQLLPRVKCYSKGNAGQQLFHVRGLV